MTAGFISHWLIQTYGFGRELHAITKPEEAARPPAAETRLGLALEQLPTRFEKELTMRGHAAAAVLLGLSIVVGWWRLTPAQQPATAESTRGSARKAMDSKDATSAAVDQLVEQLRLHPARPSKAVDRIAGLYLIEVATGEVTLIADPPDASITFIGSPEWSNDGKRILCDAMRTTEVERAHIKAIELVGGKLTISDLGVGNCPTSSPTGDRIAFLLNHGGVPGAEAGVWLMQGDGSQRRHLGSYGRPKWSPDSRQFMLIGFSTPAPVTLMDVRPEKSGPLQLPDLRIYSIPNWVSDGVIVAVVGAAFGDTIALIDVTDPAQGRVKEVLWKMNFKGGGLNIQPSYPSYQSSTRRCVFVGKGPQGHALYSFERGQAGPPQRLEPQGYDSLMQDVAMSPDGRYAVFSSNRTGPRQRGSAPRAGAPKRKAGANGKAQTSRSTRPREAPLVGLARPERDTQPE
jgi:Tol biopolymer transport system component